MRKFERYSVQFKGLRCNITSGQINGGRSKMAESFAGIGMDVNRSLSNYLEEIGKYEPLKPKEEVRLAKLVRSEDKNKS